MTIPNTTLQRDFDREKHLSIGQALKEQRNRDIEDSIAKVKAAEDNFRGLSEVEQQEFLSNQGIEAETKHLVRRTGNVYPCANLCRKNLCSCVQEPIVQPSSKKAATNGSTTTPTAAAGEVQQTQRVSTPRSGPNSIFSVCILKTIIDLPGGLTGRTYYFSFVPPSNSLAWSWTLEELFKVT